MPMKCLKRWQKVFPDTRTFLISHMFRVVLRLWMYLTNWYVWMLWTKLHRSMMKIIGKNRDILFRITCHCFTINIFSEIHPAWISWIQIFFMTAILQKILKQNMSQKFLRMCAGSTSSEETVRDWWMKFLKK